MFSEFEFCKKMIGLALYVALAHAIDAGKHAYVLLYGQVFVEGKLLTHISYVFFYLLILGGDVAACHPPATACRLVQSRKDVHSRGLARTNPLRVLIL